MTPLSCHDVEPHLDLFAADECDPATHAVVERHLAGCAACARTAAAAREVVGLVELTLRQPQALRRLHERLQAEARPRAHGPRLRTLVARASSLAALVLVTVGLVRLAGPGALPDGGLPEHGGFDLAASLQVPKARGDRILPEMPAAAKRGHEATKEKERGGLEAIALDEPVKTAVASFPLDLGGKSADAFRHSLETDLRPPPPEVNMTLKIYNNSKTSLRVWVGGPRFALRLALRGPGVVSVPVADPDHRPFAKVRPVRVAAGEALSLKVERLVSVQPGEVRYLYWTEPGEYTLTATVRAVAVREGPQGEGARETVTLRPAPITLRVERER